MSTSPTQSAPSLAEPSSAPQPPSARSVGPPAAAPIHMGGIVVRFLVEREHTGGGLAMFEFDVPSGAKVPAAHYHDAYEETIYALRGQLTWTVDGERFALAPGKCAVIPRGAIHRFDNFGDETSTTLAVITPGVLGPEYFQEIAAVIVAARGGPPDMAAVAGVMRRHGLTPA